jgi:hypothetical protein
LARSWRKAHLLFKGIASAERGIGSRVGHKTRTSRTYGLSSLGERVGHQSEKTRLRMKLTQSGRFDDYYLCLSPHFQQETQRQCIFFRSNTRFLLSLGSLSATVA